MNIILHTLNVASNLNPFVKEIDHIFYPTVEKITAKIPVSNVDVVVANNPQGAIPEIGVGGKTYNPHLVFISIDAKFPNLKNSLEEKLERSLAHELHHCIRWDTVGYGKTLLETMISEGLAVHFVIEITGKDTDPWNTILTHEEIKKYLQRAKTEFDNEKYNHNAWFFGRNTDIPKWTGYSLGFYLVKEYLKKHPDKKPSQLYDVKAKEFI